MRIGSGGVGVGRGAGGGVVGAIPISIFYHATRASTPAIHETERVAKWRMKKTAGWAVKWECGGLFCQ